MSLHFWNAKKPCFSEDIEYNKLELISTEIIKLDDDLQEIYIRYCDMIKILEIMWCLRVHYVLFHNGRNQPLLACFILFVKVLFRITEPWLGFSHVCNQNKTNVT